jgi:hypothetical protein
VHKKYSGLLATISPGGVHRGRRTAVRGSSTAGGLGGSSPRTNTAGAADVAPGANTGDDDV